MQLFALFPSPSLFGRAHEIVLYPSLTFNFTDWLHFIIGLAFPVARIATGTRRPEHLFLDFTTMQQ